MFLRIICIGGEIVLDAYVKNTSFTGNSNLTGNKISAKLNLTTEKVVQKSTLKNLFATPVNKVNKEFNLGNLNINSLFNNKISMSVA